MWQMRLEPYKQEEMKQREVYERQCILLKSLICLTRTLPAYQAARNRYEEKFEITYDIYKRDPGDYLTVMLHIYVDKVRSILAQTLS